jgi:hypothetical protein
MREADRVSPDAAISARNSSDRIQLPDCFEGFAFSLWTKSLRLGRFQAKRPNGCSNSGPQLPSNHSPLFAPVPKPTIETGIEAMTLAVLSASAFDQHARRK